LPVRRDWRSAIAGFVVAVVVGAAVVGGAIEVVVGRTVVEVDVEDVERVVGEDVVEADLVVDGDASSSAHATRTAATATAAPPWRRSRRLNALPRRCSLPLVTGESCQSVVRRPIVDGVNISDHDG
jgi:hypothetical protein